MVLRGLRSRYIPQALSVLGVEPAVYRLPTGEPGVQVVPRGDFGLIEAVTEIDDFSVPHGREVDQTLFDVLEFNAERRHCFDALVNAIENFGDLALDQVPLNEEPVALEYRRITGVPAPGFVERRVRSL
jgi:hypothetical protein